MHTHTFFDALAEALEVHGYDVTRDAALEGKSGQIYSCPILAERDGAAILFEGRLGADIADADTVRTLHGTIMDTGADSGVVCHTGMADGDARTAGHGIVDLWDNTRITNLLGRAQLHKSLGSSPPMFNIEGAMERLLRDGPPPGPPHLEPRPAPAPIDVDHLLADTKCAKPVPETLVLPPAFQAPTPPAFSVADLIEAAEKDAPQAIDFNLNVEPSGPHVRASTEAKPEVLEDHKRTRGLPRFSHPMLPVQVPYDAAVRFAKDKVHGVARSELIVHPVYLYDYECDLIQEGSLRYDTEKGRIEVDGTKPATQVADVHPEADDLFAPVPGLGYDERGLRIEPQKASKLAEDHIAKLHTRMVEVETSTEDDTFFYKEKRAVKPQKEHIRLTPVGIYMRPVWRLVGSNGTVDVDAIDGRRLDENLRNPSSDILIID